MQVTDEMVWRIVNLDPNYFSEDQARAMLEHVLGGEPEPAPEWSLDKVIPRLLSALEASQKPLSEEERMRNLRADIAAVRAVRSKAVIESHPGEISASGIVARLAVDVDRADAKQAFSGLDPGIDSWEATG